MNIYKENIKNNDKQIKEYISEKVLDNSLSKCLDVNYEVNEDIINLENEAIKVSNNKQNLTMNEFKCEIKDKNKNIIKNPRIKVNYKTVEYIKDDDYSNKVWGVTLVLCILLGFTGFHRFYVGKAGTAIVMLLTFGGFGIWVLVDLISIIMDNFTDEEGKIVKRNSLAS